MTKSSDLLRGHTETIILRILMESDSYGYAVSKTIVDEGKGLIDIKDATIYIAFRRMEDEGLLVTYWGDGVGGARRRYYAITDKGRQLYADKKAEWENIKDVLDNLIIGGKK